MMSGPEIEFRNVSVGYRNRAVLSDVTLNITPGEIYCVFGRNGSGKTTLLKSLAGFIPVLSGDILIGGKDGRKMNTVERSKVISVVLTDKIRISNMNVLEYVTYGRYPYSDWLGYRKTEDIKIIERAIEMCYLDSYKQRLLEELSDGELQKVKLARALAQDVPVLLLDEMVSHLDLVNKAEIFQLIRDICNSGGKTVLFTSHDIQFALQLAGSFVLVKDGSAGLVKASEFRDNKLYLDFVQSPYLQFDAENNSLKYGKFS